MKGILRSRHRNKLNTDKQGYDRIFYVVTMIPTQGREVLSRHDKLGRDRKYLQHQETMSQHRNEVIKINQVKWRQDSIATEFPGHDINADNIETLLQQEPTDMLSRHKN